MAIERRYEFLLTPTRQEVERRKESPAKAWLSLQQEPSNVTFTIESP